LQSVWRIYGNICCEPYDECGRILYEFPQAHKSFWFSLLNSWEKQNGGGMTSVNLYDGNPYRFTDNRDLTSNCDFTGSNIDVGIGTAESNHMFTRFIKTDFYLIGFMRRIGYAVHRKNHLPGVTIHAVFALCKSACRIRRFKHYFDSVAVTHRLTGFD